MTDIVLPADPATAIEGRTSPRPAAIFALVLFATALVLLAGALDTADQPTDAVVWGGLSLASFAGGLCCLVGGASGLARWKLGPWTMLWYSLTFGVASITWSQIQTGPPAQIAISNVLRALWLVAIGSTAWTVGYLAGPGWPVRRAFGRGMAAVSRRYGARVRGRWTPWLLYAIGATARVLVSASTHRFGYVGSLTGPVTSASSYQQVLGLISNCAPLAVCAAALRGFGERAPRAWATLAVLCVTEVAFGAVSGGKETFVLVALAIIIPMSAAHYRLPKTAIAGGILLFLVVVIPFNQAYRDSVTSELTPRQAMATTPGILRQITSPHSLLTAVPTSVTYLLQRLREVDSPAIIMQRTGTEIPFLDFAQMIEQPVADAIPRVLWPGKPILASGYQFSQEYFGLPSTVYTSSAITPLGDLYRYGGWLPVVIGMLLMGVIVRLLDSVMEVRKDPHAIMLIVMLTPALLLGESDWATTLASLPEIGVVWLLIVMLTFSRGTLATRRAAAPDGGPPIQIRAVTIRS